MINNNNNRINKHVSEALTSCKQLSAAAKRALAEAEERRKLQSKTKLPVESNGRGGIEPVRFGDWEVNGRAIDF